MGGVEVAAHDCAALTRSFGGTVKAFGCSGVGNHGDGVDHEYLSNSSSSSPTWRRRIARGVRSGSPAELRLKLGLYGVAANSASVHATSAEARRQQSAVAVLGDISSQPRRRGTGLRLLRGRDCRLPATRRHRGDRDPAAVDAIAPSIPPPKGQSSISVWPSDDGASRLLVHDRDGIFAPAVDDALASMSLRVLKTPVRTPQANAHCERFIGSARRECLDWMIPLDERHLRRVLAEWIPHYNGERPHSALGPGLPDEPTHRATLTGHRLPPAHRVVASARLGGLHHDYRVERVAA